MALADPPEILRWEKGDPARRALPADARPVAMTIDDNGLYVATGDVDSSVLHFDVKSLALVDTSPALPDGEVDPWGAHVSSVPTSIATSLSRLWVVTGGSRGEAGLFACDRDPLSECRWGRPAYTTEASATLSNVRDLSLAGGSPVWAITSGTTPSSLYRLGDDGVVEFDGHDYRSVSCAWGLAVSPRGNPLLVSCDQELTALQWTGNNLKVVHSVPLGITNDDGPGRWIEHHLSATANGTVYVGITTLSNATTPFTAIRARVVRAANALDKGSADVRQVFELPGAEIVALAASDDDAVVIVRVGGRFDAYDIGG
jgi:hypothetical protein